MDYLKSNIVCLTYLLVLMSLRFVRTAKRPAVRPVQTAVFDFESTSSGQDDVSSTTNVSPVMAMAEAMAEATTGLFVATTTPFSSFQLRRPLFARARPHVSSSTAGPVRFPILRSDNPFPVMVAKSIEITSAISVPDLVEKQSPPTQSSSISARDGISSQRKFNRVLAQFPSQTTALFGENQRNPASEERKLSSNLAGKSGASRTCNDERIENSKNLAHARSSLLQILQFLSQGLQKPEKLTSDVANGLSGEKM